MHYRSAKTSIKGTGDAATGDDRHTASGAAVRAARAGTTGVPGSSLPRTSPVLRQSIRNNPFEPAARVDIDAWRNKIRIIEAARRYADL